MDVDYYDDYVFNHFSFSIIIIFFLSNSLRHNEVDEAERSSEDIVKLFESKQIEHVTPLDLNASLGNFQKVMLFNEDGHKLMETSNDNSITFSPNIVPTNVNRIAVKSDHKKIISSSQIILSHQNLMVTV